MRSCLTLGQKQAKNAFFVFLAFFCPYIRQPHDHIGWATLMGFLSMNPTNSRTGLWNFREKISRIGDFEKWPFWKIGHFEFFSPKNIRLGRNYACTNHLSMVYCNNNKKKPESASSKYCSCFDFTWLEMAPKWSKVWFLEIVCPLKDPW